MFFNKRAARNRSCIVFFRLPLSLIFIVPTIQVAAAEVQSASCRNIYNSITLNEFKPSSPLSFAEINTEMLLPHPEPPLGGGAGWSKYPIVVMGTEPYSSSLPWNWKGTQFPTWRAVIPWYVVYPSLVKTRSKNSAVQIGKIQLWYLSRTFGSWNIIATNNRPTWQGNFDESGKIAMPINIPSDLQNCDGIASPNFGQHSHGGLGKYPTPWNEQRDKADIDALLVIVWHKLIRLNPNEPEDTPQARFVVMAGADYYPNVNSRLADLNAAYVPGVALGQFKVAEYKWKASTMIVWSSRFKDKNLPKPHPISPEIVP